jgi:hypothetical protein
MLAVLVPGYLLVGRAAIAAVAGRAAGSPALYAPWQLLTRLLDPSFPNSTTDLIAAIGTVILAVILLRRLPAGQAGFPFAQPALALMLAWLIMTPQQRPWYDAAIFPLLALMPASRLDWIVGIRALAAALAELPGVIYYAILRPGWISGIARGISTDLAPAVLIAVAIALIWLCVSGKWNAPAGTLAEPLPLPRPVRHPLVGDPAASD